MFYSSLQSNISCFKVWMHRALRLEAPDRTGCMKNFYFGINCLFFFLFNNTTISQIDTELFLFTQIKYNLSSNSDSYFSYFHNIILNTIISSKHTQLTNYVNKKKAMFIAVILRIPIWHNKHHMCLSEQRMV